MAYDKTNDFEAIQADVLTTDMSTNTKISKLKQLKTDTKVPTKAINATYEQLGNAQASAADALQRVGAFEDDMTAVHENMGTLNENMTTLDANMNTVADNMATMTENVTTFQADVTEQVTVLRNAVAGASGKPVEIKSSVLDDINKQLRDKLHAEYKDIVSFTGMTGTKEVTTVEQGQTITVPREASLADYAPTKVTGVVFSNAPTEDVPIYWDPNKVNINRAGDYPLTGSYGLGYYSAADVYPQLVFHIDTLGKISLEDWYTNGATLNEVSHLDDPVLEELSDYEITSLTRACVDNTVLESVPELILVNDTTPASNAFSGCTNLTSVGAFTRNHTLSSAASMFKNCTALTSVPAFTVSGTTAASMFENCTSIMDLSMVTLDVSNINNVCAGCTALPSSKLPVFTSKVSDANSAFENCVLVDTIPEQLLACTNLTSAFAGTSITTVSGITGTPDLTSAFANCKQLITVEALPEATNMTRAFENCTALTSIPKTINKAKNFVSTFAGCTQLTSVRTIANASYMTSTFENCTALESVYYIGSMSGGMTSTFSGCTALTTVGNITSFDGMASTFSGCESLTTVGSINATGNMTSTFADCTALTTIGNIKCTGTMSSVFENCQSLTMVGNIDYTKSMDEFFNGYSALTTVGNITNVTSMVDAFTGCSQLTSIGDLPGTCTSFKRAFKNCYALPAVFPGVIDVSGCTSYDAFEDMFADTNVTEVHVCCANGVPWYVAPGYMGVSRVVIVDNDGNEIETRDETYSTTLSWMYSTSGQTETLKMPSYINTAHVQALSGFKAVAVNDQYPYPVFNASSFGNKVVSLSDASAIGYQGEFTSANNNKGNFPNMRGANAMFYPVWRTNVSPMTSSSQRSAGTLSYRLASNGRSCWGYLMVNSSLVVKDVEVTPNELVTVKVGKGELQNSSEDSWSMFESGTSNAGFLMVHLGTRKPVPTGDDVVTCTSTSYKMSQLFSNYATMTTLPKRLNTSKTGLTYYMFSGCAALTELDLTEVDTSTSINFDYMFSGCSSLATLDGTQLDMSSATTAQYMFSGCSSLTEIELLTTSKNCTNFSYMFNNCSALKKVTLGLDFTKNSAALSTMFTGCTALEEVDLLHAVKFGGSYAASLFASKTNLKKVTLPSKWLCLSGSASSMFSGCTNLETIDGVIDLKNVTTYNDMFKNCTKLTGVKLKNVPYSVTAESGFAGLEAGQYEIVV